MSSHTLLVVGAVVVAATVTAYGGYRTRKAWKLRQAISGATTISTGSIRPGEGAVELTGTAEAAEHTFRSPLTDQECVAYRFLKEEKQKKRVTDHTSDTNRRKTKYEWVTIHEEEGGAPFYVDDGVGRSLVDGATAELDMTRSYEVDTDDVTEGIGEKVVATVKGLVGEEPEDEAYEIPQQYVEELRNASYGRRFKEWVVHEGEEVYVYGEAVAPEQTPLGSGLDDEMSAAADAMQGGGALSLLKGFVDLGTDAVTDPQTRYKPRAIERLSHAQPAQGGGDDTDTAEPTDTERNTWAEETTDTERNTWAEETTDAPDAGQQDQDWQAFASQSQQRESQNPATAGEMMDQATEMVQQAESAVEDRLPATPSLDGERVVVSWGEQAPTFVVSDKGKGSVLRDYSTDVGKYALLTLVGVAVAVGAVVVGFGLF